MRFPFSAAILLVCLAIHQEIIEFHQIGMQLALQIVPHLHPPFHHMAIAVILQFCNFKIVQTQPTPETGL
jgi:hypothetical protein